MNKVCTSRKGTVGSVVEQYALIYLILLSDINCGKEGDFLM